MFKLTYLRIGRSDSHALKTILKLTVSIFRWYPYLKNDVGSQVYTVLLLCVAIAARAPFKGVATFDSNTKHARTEIVATEIQSWGGVSNIEGESLSCQLHYRSAHKKKKKRFCPRQFKVQRSV